MRQYILLSFLIIIFKPVYALPESFADLVEKLSPSVVSIASTTIIENNSQNQIPQFPEGSPFDEFFKDYFDRDQRRSQRPMTGLGSGFIISEEGIIVRCQDKICRLKNLLSKVEEEVNNESIEDSYRDLANYALIGILLHKKDWD